MGLMAYGIARHSTTIFELVEMASAFSSAGIFVVGCFALATSIGGAAAAGATLLTGVGVWAAGEAVFHWPAPYLTAIAASTAVYLLVAAAEPIVSRFAAPRGQVARGD